MGGFGTSFAQSFMAAQGIAQQRQELEQRKKEADLRGKLMDLQVNQIQQKIASGQALRDLLTAQQPASRGGTALDLGENPEAAGIMPAMQPKPFSTRDLAIALTPVDPEGAVKLFIDQEKADREQKNQERAMAFAERFAPGAMTGNPPAPAAVGTAMPSETSPAASTTQPNAQPATEQPFRSGAPQFEGFSIDPSTGKMNLKFGQNDLEVKDSNIESSPGSGIWYHRRDFIDKKTGVTVGTQFLGRPTTGEGMQRVESIVRSWGLNPLTSLGQAAIGDVFAALAFQGSEEQNIALDRARQKYYQVAGTVGRQAAPAQQAAVAPPVPSPQTSVLEEARSQRVRQVGRETQIREQTQREEQPPQSADRTRLIQLQSIERQGNIVRDAFRPEFVGKGLKAFSGDLKREYDAQEKAATSQKYAAGALPGALRKYLGKASPEEVQFRSALLDMSDLLLRARSGAQINEQEYQRLKSLLPDLYDEPNTFIPALRRFTTEAGKQLDDTLKLGGSSMKQLQEERAQSKKKPTLRYDPATDRLIPVAP